MKKHMAQNQNGIGTQAKLAVINCKGQKRKEACTAEEMYMPSYVHRTQLAFVKEYYDAYIILSAVYGVLFPDDIIEPYSVILHTSSTSKALAKNQAVVLSREETKEWAKKVAKHPVFGQYSHVDFHLPLAYWRPLEAYADAMCESWYRVAYPQSLITTGHRYEELLHKLQTGEDVDLAMMGKKLVSKFPEQKRYYYHRNHSPFFGWARDLVKEYPKQRLDEGALVRVDKTSVDGERYKHAATHHKGWCCNPKILKGLYLDEKNTWRYTKANLDMLTFE